MVEGPPEAKWHMHNEWHGFSAASPHTKPWPPTFTHQGTPHKRAVYAMIANLDKNFDAKSISRKVPSSNSTLSTWYPYITAPQRFRTFAKAA